MNMKANFIILDCHGIECDSSYTFIANYEDYDNLNILHEHFYHQYNHPFYLFRNRNIHRYVYVEHIPSFMWDVMTGELLPNKFTR